MFLGVRLLLLSILALSGCASFKGRTTHVKVVSNPPGELVSSADGVPLGRTPLFASVTRGRRSTLVIGADRSDATKLQLEPTYRWQESFAANLVWIHPAFWASAWSIDLLTGAAWDLEDPKPFVTAKAKNVQIRHKVMSLVVAPIESQSELLSDELSRLVEIRLRELFPTAKVLTHAETRDEFAAANWEPGHLLDGHLRDELSRRLQLSHIVEAKLIDEPGLPRLHLRLVDVFTEQAEDLGIMSIDPGLLPATRLSFTQTALSLAVEKLPNTFGLQLIGRGSSDVKASLPNQESLVAESHESRSTIIDQVSRISLRNYIHPRGSRGFRGRFRWTTDFAYSRDTFSLRSSSGAPNLSNETYFRYQVINAGLGPEIGLHTPSGYLYLQLIPSVAWSSIEVHQPNRSDGFSNTDLIMSIELGFALWISESFNLRLASVARTANQEIWRRTFESAGVQGVKVESFSYVTSGITLGYFFPQAKTVLRESLFR